MVGLRVKVIFYKNIRKTFPKRLYRPHFIVEGTNEYLGIIFTKLDNGELGEHTEAEIEFLYNGVDYSKLKIGKKFTINEGAIIVGAGIVLSHV